jgi:hypothetical protein
MTSRWNEFYILPERLSIVGITILGLVFLKRSVRLKASDVKLEILTHERIHVRQWLETGLILFAVWYLVEYVIRRIQYGNWNDAYENISFEREAYTKELDPFYLSERKFWSFINYL